ncbi:hypothetical protein Vretimale_2423 [Volvox reticuliferus]|uniref:Uncharacterized protein n=1 Tax=Volvox reticuliferus TaxID=1737510 RepID=A0A8J4D6G1_9CHLO|nr:hypothetical protein Vretifemale_4632 [Volvox reticuliferus]GIL96662.1 hypothetical protein Vretimale_2423 [Volvox reticuliferus]
MYEIWRSRSSIGFQRPKLDGTQSPVLEASTPLGRIHSATVNFKDISIGPEVLELADSDIDDDDRHSQDSTNKSAILLKPPKAPNRTKYVIILVGLPGRGKTFLCNKIKCYLNWLGHHTRHFNVGTYRRLQKGDHEVQNADFFDAHNPAGIEARNRALNAALDDLQAYLYSDTGQVAIFDATNTTVERRRLLINRFHNRFQYLFIESICTDEKVLEQNYRFKMQYSPDYRGMGMQQSLSDFKARIHKYEEVYESINDRNLHYIKLIDMVTGRGHMDVNRISGYLPGKIVFFLMQVCKAGMAQARRIWLTRHGQSEYNLKSRIGGNSPLAPAGEVYARCLSDMLIDRVPQDGDQRVPVSVWTSTLCRTIQTARYLPFFKLRWKALDEIQAGTCDGLTYDEIAQLFPEEFAARQKDKLRYRYPAGESYLDVIQRLEPVIIEMEREKESIVVVGHQAVLRAVLGYFMAKPLESIPTLDVPLHTLLELRPRPDGTMDFEYIHMSPEAAAKMEANMAAGAPPGPFSSGSFSGAPSPMLSPMYSMGRHDSPVVATAAAAAVAIVTPLGGSASRSALDAASASAWSLSKNSSSPFEADADAAEGDAMQVATPSEAVTATATAAGESDKPAVTSPTKSHHSRAPSLTAGMGGAEVSVTGNSPSPAFHFAASPADTVTTTGVGDGSGLESPSTRSAVLAAAVADSRTRKVHVPFGATMGGGGSEGGAPPDLLLAGHLTSSLGAGGTGSAGTLSWSPARGALPRGMMESALSAGNGEMNVSIFRDMQQIQRMLVAETDGEGDDDETADKEGNEAERLGSGMETAVRKLSSVLEEPSLSLSFLPEAQSPNGTACVGEAGTEIGGDSRRRNGDGDNVGDGDGASSS